MSSPTFHSEELPRSHERRRLIRQRVRSLAYLDVGPDNGGIVLNLSEKGLALQAVNPFFGQTRVTLRIQPPKSRRRIEAGAEITWLSESKREAGLQFLELSEDARAEIADWVAAEGEFGEHRPPNDEVASHPRQLPSPQITEQSPRSMGKWSILLGDPALEETLANQKARNNLENRSLGSGDVESQGSASPSKNFLSDPATHPNSDVMVIPPKSDDEAHSPVGSQIVPEHVSRVAELPTLESTLPAVAAPSDALKRPYTSKAIAFCEEALKSSLPKMKSTIREFRFDRIRNLWPIGALCVCTALVFLLLGMAVARGWFDSIRGKSSPHESSSSVTPSSPLIARDKASRGEKSGSTSRRTTVAEGANAVRLERPGRHNDEARGPNHQEGETNSPVAKLSIPTAPIESTMKSDSPIASGPSLPLVPVYAAGTHNPALEPAAVNAAPPGSAERRSDCYLLYRVEPLYPREARERHIEGTVTIHLMIGSDGRVRGLHELSGPEPLVPAALAAAREWRFIPALLNGKPIDAEKDVNIEFRLLN